MMKKDKKAKMEISIVLLVMFILVLTISSLFIFSLKKDDADEKLLIYSIAEKIYVQEELIKYYVDSIYAKTGNDVNLFNTELEKHKDSQGDYFIRGLQDCKDFVCNLKIVESEGNVRISYLFSYDPRDPGAQIVSQVESPKEDNDIYLLNIPKYFQIYGQTHSITLKEFTSQGVILEIKSQIINLDLDLGEIKEIDLDNDGYYDLRITLVSRDIKTGSILVEKTSIFKRGISNEQVIAPEDYSTIRADSLFTDYGSPYPESIYSGQDFAPEIKRFPVGDWAPSLEADFGYGIGMPCGPAAMHVAISQLGIFPDTENLMQESVYNGIFNMGFKRGFLSLFSKKATGITWPSEIVEMAESRGLKVEKISGSNANLNTAKEKSSQNSVVIARVGSLFNQHITVYDTNLDNTNYMDEEGNKNVYYDGTSPDSKIRELYVLTK